MGSKKGRKNTNKGATKGDGKTDERVNLRTAAPAIRIRGQVASCRVAGSKLCFVGGQPE